MLASAGTPTQGTLHETVQEKRETALPRKRKAKKQDKSDVENVYEESPAPRQRNPRSDKMSVILNKLLVNTSAAFNRGSVERTSQTLSQSKSLSKSHATISLVGSENQAKQRGEGRDYASNITVHYATDGKRQPHYYNNVGPGHYHVPDGIGNKTHLGRYTNAPSFKISSKTIASSSS